MPENHTRKSTILVYMSWGILLSKFLILLPLKRLINVWKTRHYNVDDEAPLPTLHNKKIATIVWIKARLP